MLAKHDAAVGGPASAATPPESADDVTGDPASAIEDEEPASTLRLEGVESAPPSGELAHAAATAKDKNIVVPLTMRDFMRETASPWFVENQ